MPTYEYVCTECQQRVEMRATVAEKERGLKISCPQCGGQKMAQVFNSFMMTGSAKNTDSAPSCGPGCSCCG